MGVPARAPIVDDSEEPTSPGGRRLPAAPVAVEAEALEALAGQTRNLGFRLALLVPELRGASMPATVRQRLGRDLRELSAAFGETASTIDPR